MGGSNGMLNGLTSDLVDQSKSRVTLFILHPCTPFVILVPMLQQPNQKHKSITTIKNNETKIHKKTYSSPNKLSI
jgi:hypothetical protein